MGQETAGGEDHRVSGRWPPLVSLRPRGALTDKLEWTDPAVDQEPRRLFKSDNPGSLKRFFRQAPARIRARRGAAINEKLIINSALMWWMRSPFFLP